MGICSRKLLLSEEQMDETSPLAFGNLLAHDPALAPVYGCAKLDKTKKEEIINVLKMLYSRYFAEDPQDGTSYDCFILAELEKMKKYKPPTKGGCWFCHKDGGTMLFSTEFDTYVHESCLMDGNNGNNIETEIMRKELLAK